MSDEYAVTSPEPLEPDRAVFPDANLLPGSHLGYSKEPFGNARYGR